MLRSQSDGWHAGSRPKFPAELCEFIASAIAAVAPAGKSGDHTSPACMDKNPVVGPPVVPPPGSSLSSSGSSLEPTPQAQPSTCTTGDAANLCDPDASTCTTADTANSCHTDAFAENADLDKNPVVGPPVGFPPGSSLSSTGSSLKRTPQAPPNTCNTGEAATFCNPDAENALRSGVEASGEHRGETYKFLPKGEPSAEVDRAIAFRPELCGNNGVPVRVSWAGSEGPLTDGFGLCSPSRWTPSARGARLGETAQRFASAMRTLMKSFVLRVIPDVERSAMELVLGRYTSSPFSEKDMSQLRHQWVSLLGDSQGFDLLEVPERQPFFLPALARTAELLEDPDWEIVTQGNDNFCTGVPLGCEEVLPQVPQVFDFKYKSRTLDESEYDWDRSNYQSAREFEAPLHEKFKEEERLGRMFPTTLGALKEQFGTERIRIASLGAIGKPDGGARPIHDATHGVQVNNAIKIESQQAVPGPADLSYVVEEPIRRGEVPFCVSADVTAAHRLSKVRRQDWPYLACRVDDTSPTIWVNTVGTFGVSSASFWWSRLFGIIGRVVTRCLIRVLFFHLVFVDDLHANFSGRNRYLYTLMWLALFEMIGTPFSYKKFKGGFRVQFIGYELDYKSRTMGISASRGRYVIEWIQNARRQRFVVLTRDFAEFLGRLGFIARTLHWLKPHLGPLYAWSAATAKGTAATLPLTVILTLEYISKILQREDFHISVRRVQLQSEPSFHTDAKCADGFVVLGGWESLGKSPKEARWFSLKIYPADAPYLFDAKQKSQWASASAELLGTLAALHCFGHLKPAGAPRRLFVNVVAATDNRGNEALRKKLSTTKWPLMLVNMQLSDLIMQAGLTLSLRWKPRDENALADALTNEVFCSFSEILRVPLSFSDLPLRMLSELWETKCQFDAARATARAEPGSLRKKRRKEKTPW